MYIHTCVRIAVNYWLKLSVVHDWDCKPVTEDEIEPKITIYNKEVALDV